MKGFERKDQLLSLCGLNCGLCSMRLGGHCGGCGNGNQSCKIARCSLEHGGLEYCFECKEYPCGIYEQIEAFDSFITHRNQKSDLNKAKRIGIHAYHCEQREKIEILEYLLTNYNGGRKKSMFCLAVNLMGLSDLREGVKQIQQMNGSEKLPIKEKSAYAAKILQSIAKQRNIKLKLNKKKKI